MSLMIVDKSKKEMFFSDLSHILYNRDWQHLLGQGVQAQKNNILLSGAHQTIVGRSMGP